MVAELREIHFYGLASGKVEEAAMMGKGELLPEHDPMSRMETPVQAVESARTGAAPPPSMTHGTEADVVDYVMGKDMIGDHPGRPIGKTRPVPPAATRFRRPTSDTRLDFSVKIR